MQGEGKTVPLWKSFLKIFLKIAKKRLTKLHFWVILSEYGFMMIQNYVLLRSFGAVEHRYLKQEVYST